MSGRRNAAKLLVVLVGVVLAGCGGTITATRPSEMSVPAVPTTETTTGPVTVAADSESSPVTTSVPPLVATAAEPSIEQPRTGGQEGNGPVVVSPLKISDFTRSEGELWANYKPHAEAYVAAGCTEAGYLANCVGIDIDTTGDPSRGDPPCAILGYKRHDPLYPGDRVTVMLQRPCSEDGLTTGEGGNGSESTDGTQITAGTEVTAGTAGVGGTGGDSPTSPSQ